MKNSSKNTLALINSIINDTAAHIHDFIPSSTAFTRHRCLDCATLLRTTINMQRQSLSVELMKAAPDHDPVTVSAYEQQKDKLSVSCFQHIFSCFNQVSTFPLLFANKYRVLAVDGSDFRTPYNSESRYVINNSNHKKQCLVHINALVDVLNHAYLDLVFQPKIALQERKAALTMLRRYAAKQPTIVLMDRGYEGFNVFESCNRLGLDYIIRGRAKAIKEVRQLPDAECDRDYKCIITTASSTKRILRSKGVDVHYINPNRPSRNKALSKSAQEHNWEFGPVCPVKFRICKFKAYDHKRKRFTWEILITNLDRHYFPLEQIKALYQLRWGIETCFRSLKYDLSGIYFHSKKDSFIEMELYSHFIMYNVVSQIKNQITVPVRSNHKYRYQISFKRTFYFISNFWGQMISDSRYRKILNTLTEYLEPIRPGRHYPRSGHAPGQRGFNY